MAIYALYGRGRQYAAALQDCLGRQPWFRGILSGATAWWAMFGKLFRMIVNRQTRTCPARCGALSTRRDRGGVSRAAKGADCKSAGLAFVGSSPTSPTTIISIA